jgi:hypothetical protein
MELIEDPINSRIKDAIGVMLARSKTTGEPYSIDYTQLAHIIDYPGELSKSDLESVMNNNPDLASKFSNFDETNLEVDATGVASDIAAAAEEPDMDMPPEGEEMPPEGEEMPPEEPAPEGDMGMGGAPMGAEPAMAEPEAAIEAPAGPDLLRKAAARAAKRRSL